MLDILVYSNIRNNLNIRVYAGESGAWFAHTSSWAAASRRNRGSEKMATTFTPIASLAGGALIGLAAVMLMAFSGRIAGVSGIAARLLPPFVDRELAGRVAFLAGLVAVPSIALFATGKFPAQSIETGGVLFAFAGPLGRFRPRL